MTPGLDGVTEALGDRGFAVVRDLFDTVLIARLAAEAARCAERPLAEAGIGRTALVDAGVRRAHIAWLDGASVGQRRFLDATEDVRLALNRALFLGLFEFEAQFAVTEPGGFYARHLDGFDGARNRVVSLVVYLNRDWRAEDGGALRLWRSPSDHGPPAAEIAPQAGTSVLMLSEAVPHEVALARRRRLAVAGWWRVNRAGASAGRGG